jgi:serine/threonine protein kinase
MLPSYGQCVDRVVYNVNPRLTGDDASHTIGRIMLPPEEKHLGEGSFGRVYLSRDPALGYVAVKVLLDPEADVERFEREAKLLVEHINNVHVVNIHRWDLSPPKPYMILEYCEGPKLRSWIGRTSWQTAAMVLLHAATGLGGIHAAGGFHRDIKPENLLLARSATGEGWIVKVADFGLARRPKTSHLPMTRTLGGTEGYIAPDQQFSAASDVFSLGVVGVELMTGQRTSSALAAVDAPAAFKELLKRMLSPFAWLRPTTADVIIALGALCAPRQAAVQPKPEAAPIVSRPPAGGGLGWGLLLGGLAVAAAALAAGDKKAWDANVGRYRRPDGRFAPD